VPSERNGHSALRAPHSAFTLIEMLTVIAIIGILAAILIPTVTAVMRKARVVQATADIRQLDQAATAYNLDFGAFPPDCTAFWTDAQGQPWADVPFPGAWEYSPNNADAGFAVSTFAPHYTPLNPNELLMWYLTRQYSTGQYNVVANSYPAGGYPDNYGSPQKPNSEPLVGTTGWPAFTNVVFARGSNANTGPYFTIKAKQRTDYNGNGFSEFMDPWGRPYMYRAYPQIVVGGASVYGVNGNQVTLTLTNLDDPRRTAGGFPAAFPPPNPFQPSPLPYNRNSYVYNSDGYYSYTYFNTNSVLTGTTGSIELSGFTPASFNGVYTFTSANPNPDPNPWHNTYVTVTSANPPAVNAVGSYAFPLHNRQSCDIYSLGPYGMTRSALSMAAQQVNGAWTGTEWRPTHGGGAVGGGQLLDLPWNCPSSLDAWPQVWGTPGDGNDINSPSGNVIVNALYQDNICNW
jgi:prepilin-type N-terminal cleavage/methylation domain-containing protein